MSCLVCRHFQPKKPTDYEQHRSDQRADRGWKMHDAIDYVQNGGRNLEGWCRYYPEAREVDYDHFCGQISVYQYLFNEHYGLEPITDNDGIFNWSESALNIICHGTWRAQRTQELHEQNKKLLGRLKNVQAIAASRLKRLQKNGEATE